MHKQMSSNRCFHALSACYMRIVERGRTPHACDAAAQELHLVAGKRACARPGRIHILLLGGFPVQGHAMQHDTQ